MYKLAGIDLATFGFTPVVQANSDVAITGIFDAPARLGDAFFSWANEDGIEPYVSAEDIANGGFGGRDINLIGVIQGSGRNDCMNKLDALHALIDGFTDLVPLLCDWGTYNVYVNGAVSGDYLDERGIKVTIPMREPIVTMNGTKPAGNSADLGIDGISFEQLGGAYLELSGDRYNRPAPKKTDTIAYGKEAYGIGKKEAPELELKLALRADTYAELRAMVYGLMALLYSPGMRYLTVSGDRARSFFLKDGFTASKLHLHGEVCFCVIDMKLTESGSAYTWEELTNALGDAYTLNGETIMIKIKTYA